MSTKHPRAPKNEAAEYLKPGREKTPTWLDPKTGLEGSMNVPAKCPGRKL